MAKRHATKKSSVKVVRTPRIKSLRKHNYLVEAYYRATKQEQRIFHWAASEVNPKKPEQNVFRIRIQELMKIAGVSTHSIYEEMEEITDRLRSRKIDIRDLNTGKLLQANLVASVEYDPAQRMVDVEISKKMIPYLIALKQYTRINIEVFFSLSTGYAMRIYELMKQYQRIGKRTIYIDDLRLYLGVQDMKTYDRFNNLDYKILKPAFEQTNLKTDIHVEYLKIKNGRAVEAIQCTITSKEQNEAVSKDKNDDSPITTILSELATIGISNVSNKAIQGWLAQYGENKVRIAMDIAIENHAKGKAVGAGLIVKAMKEGWTTKEQDTRKEIKARAANSSIEHEQRKLEESVAALRTKYQDSQKKIVMQWYNNLPKAEQRDIKKAYLEKIKIVPKVPVKETSDFQYSLYKIYQRDNKQASFSEWLNHHARKNSLEVPKETLAAAIRSK